MSVSNNYAEIVQEGLADGDYEGSGHAITLNVPAEAGEVSPVDARVAEAIKLLSDQGTVFEESRSVFAIEPRKLLGVKTCSLEQQEAVDYLWQMVFASRATVTKDGENLESDRNIEYATLDEAVEIFMTVMASNKSMTVHNPRLLFSALNQHLDWLTDQSKLGDVHADYPRIIKSLNTLGAFAESIFRIAADKEDIFYLEFADFALKLYEKGKFAQRWDQEVGGKLIDVSTKLLSAAADKAGSKAQYQLGDYDVIGDPSVANGLTRRDLYAIIKAQELGTYDRANITDITLTMVNWDKLNLSPVHLAYIYCNARSRVVTTAMEFMYEGLADYFRTMRSKYSDIKAWEFFKARWSLVMDGRL